MPRRAKPGVNHMGDDVVVMRTRPAVKSTSSDSREYSNVVAMNSKQKPNAAPVRPTLKMAMVVTVPFVTKYCTKRRRSKKEEGRRCWRNRVGSGRD